MLDMVFAMALVFGGFGVAVIGYTIINVFVGMAIAVMHVHNGGNKPFKTFLDWMKYI